MEANESKQLEIDNARELLRSAGASGFSSLAEGIKQVLQQGIRTPRKFVMELDEHDIDAMLTRIRTCTVRLSEDESFRVHLPFRMEVISIALRLYHNATHTDSDDVVHSVEQQLLVALNNHINAKESSNE